MLPEFLTDVLGALVSDHPARPYVTLTYAQTIDGKIAAKGNERLHISGPESYDMTHWCDSVFKIPPHSCTYRSRMRTMHDAILCGINTVLTDDPQLKGMAS
jgi:2,5-diamino-6-(ribosylamino)-4(3H)-pyrimidinone 5'-phosphate reductase